MSTTTLAPGALEILRGTPRVLATLLAALPDTAVTTQGEEGWSPKDIAAHLASLTGPTFVDRVTLMLEQDDPAIPGVDEHETLDRSGLRDKPLNQLLDDFAREREEAVAWASKISAADLARTGTHPIAGPLTVAEVINHKAWHDLLHVRQVTALIAAPLDEGRGGMRVFV